MKSFVTLKKTDPDLVRYMMGSFSRTQVALPTEPFQIYSDKNQVTFEIFPQIKIGFFQTIEAYFNLARVHRLPWIWLPFLLTLSNVPAKEFSPTNWGLALLCLSCIHMALSLRNSVTDHMRGFDFFLKSRESAPLRKGWIRPHTVARTANLFLILSLVLGLPVLLLEPAVLAAALVLAALVLVYLFRPGFDIKYVQLGDLWQSLLLGPVFFWGLHLLQHSQMNWYAFGQSLMWSAMYLQFSCVRSLSTVLEAQKFNLKNLMAHLGFDRSVVFLKYWFVLTSFMTLAFGLLATPVWIWLPAFVFQSWFLVWAYRKLQATRSSLSSSLTALQEWNRRFLVLLQTLLAIGIAWKLLL